VKIEIARLTIREPFKSLFPVERDVVEAIAADMKKNGYDAAQSITAWKAPDGELPVIDGHQRILAAKVAGLIEVHATLRKFADEDEAFAFAIKSQRDRRNLTKQQIADALARAELKRSPTSQEVARSAGPRNAKGQIVGSTKDPVKTAVVEKAAKAGISQRTAEQALANVRAENDPTPKTTNVVALPTPDKPKTAAQRLVAARKHLVAIDNAHDTLRDSLVGCTVRGTATDGKTHEFRVTRVGYDTDGRAYVSRNGEGWKLFVDEIVAITKLPPVTEEAS